MSAGCCATTARRVRRSASWAVPAAVLVLMPKCPVCLAAYVLAATGVSMSVAAAGWLRAGLIAASVAALLGLALGVIRRRRRRARPCACAAAAAARSQTRQSPPGSHTLSDPARPPRLHLLRAG